MYLRLNMPQKSIYEAVIALSYDPFSYKLYAYILLNLLPKKNKTYLVMLAPIVIFAFNRPEALQKLLDSLRMNSFYEESDKYIFIDGPRCEEDKAKVDEVVTIARKVASNISISPVNRGLGNSIIAGVSTIIAEYGKAIVLEDDLICAPNFLSYMNQALDFYENDNKIISICGYGLKIKRPRGYVGDVYLLGRSSSWGWATWKDRWEQIDWDIQDWNEFSSNKQMRRAFNKNGSDMYSMLKGYMEGKKSFVGDTVLL